MDDVLFAHEEPLVEGTVVARPNRFVLEVDFGHGPERAFLADPGELAFLSTNSRVLCSPVDDPDRSTDYDAVAGRARDCWVSLRAALANRLFAAALDRDALPGSRATASSRPNRRSPTTAAATSSSRRPTARTTRTAAWTKTATS